MKKIIITTLKFANNKLEIEAVEQTSFSNFVIYKDSVNTLFSNLKELKLFVKNAKENIEKQILGRISEIIVLVSRDNFTKLTINSYLYQKSFLIRKNESLNEVKYSLEKHIQEQFKISNRFIIDQKTHSENIIKNVNNSVLEVKKIISSLDNNVVKQIFSICSVNDLNIAKICMFDELQKINFLTSSKNNIFIELMEDAFKISLFSDKTMLKIETFPFGKNLLDNDIVKKISMPLNESNYLTSLIFNNEINLVKKLIKENGLLNKCVDDFYEFLFKKISEFLQNLNLNQIKINLCNELAKNEDFKFLLSKTINSNQVYFLNQSKAKISNELTQLIDTLNPKEVSIEKTREFITTEIFTIESNVLQNMKINKRKPLFI
ncbi:hypothetical protein [Metamycoplasma buccale]|uniref:hypothetical protein n=1 Tax=Metamycoplasma buccale TaxID=55602 RepID=UPI00398F3164